MTDPAVSRYSPQDVAASQNRRGTDDEHVPGVGEPGNRAGRLFPPGQSGNPSGRPKGIARRTREIMGDDADTLLMYLAHVVADTQASYPDRTAAAKVLLERGWGKAPVYAPIEDGDPLEMAEALQAEIAASFDQRLDELREKREAREGSPRKRKAS